MCRHFCYELEDVREFFYRVHRTDRAPRYKITIGRYPNWKVSCPRTVCNVSSSTLNRLEGLFCYHADTNSCGFPCRPDNKTKSLHVAGKACSAKTHWELRLKITFDFGQVRLFGHPFDEPGDVLVELVGRLVEILFLDVLELRFVWR